MKVRPGPNPRHVSDSGEPKILTVRDPSRGNQPIPEGGCDVPRSRYWLRKLAAGEVVMLDKDPDAKPEPAGETPASSPNKSTRRSPRTREQD